MTAKVDLTGKRYGALLVLSRLPKRRWLLQCDCGQTHAAFHSNITCGRTTSCGCLRNELVRKAKTKHGHTSYRGPCSLTYSTWTSMIGRTTNPSHTVAKHYHARGITVCDRWRASFENFLADMGERPTKGHSIDRIDNERGYEPGNCRWATRGEQARNTRRTIHLEHNGRTMCVKDWANLLGISPTTLRIRLRRGWPLERALTTPAMS